MSMTQSAWLLFGVGGLLLLAALVVALRRFYLWLRGVAVKGSAAPMYLIAGVCVVGTATCWGVGAMLAFWLAPMTEGRDAGVARFLAAVENGDPNGIRAAAAEDAQLDYAFLAYLRGISGFDVRRSQLNGEGSCLQGMIGDHMITMKVVERSGEWRVLRAANLDPQECDEELSGVP